MHLDGLKIMLGPDFRAVFPVVLNLAVSGQVWPRWPSEGGVAAQRAQGMLWKTLLHCREMMQILSKRSLVSPLKPACDMQLRQ